MKVDKSSEYFIIFIDRIPGCLENMNPKRSRTTSPSPEYNLDIYPAC